MVLSKKLLVISLPYGIESWQKAARQSLAPKARVLQRVA